MWSAPAVCAWMAILVACAEGPADERQRLGVEGYGTTEENPIPMLVVPIPWRDGIVPEDLQGAGAAGRAPLPGELGSLVAPMALSEHLTDGVLYGSDAYVPWVDELGGLAVVVRPELGAIDAPWVSGQEPVTTTTAAATLGTAWVIDMLFDTAICASLWYGLTRALSPEGRAATGEMTRDVVGVGTRTWSWMVSRAQPVANDQAVASAIDRAVTRARQSIHDRSCAELGAFRTTAADAVPLGMVSNLFGQPLHEPVLVSLATVRLCQQGSAGIVRSPAVIRATPFGVLTLVLVNVGQMPVGVSLGGSAPAVAVPGPGVQLEFLPDYGNGWSPVELLAPGAAPTRVEIVSVQVRLQ